MAIMLCNSVSIMTYQMTKEIWKEQDILRSSFSCKNSHDGAQMRKSYSNKYLCWLKIKNSLRLKDKTMKLVNNAINCCGDEGEDDCEIEYEDEDEDEDEDENDHEAAGEMNIDRKSFFLKLLRRVSWLNLKRFSQLAFLCNMAYVIPDIKAKDLKRYYGLNLVTSSFVKKAEATATEAGVPDLDKTENTEQMHMSQPSGSNVMAALAASYVHSSAKELLSVFSEPQFALKDVIKGNEIHLEDGKENPSTAISKSDMAAYIASATMTAIIAANEKQPQEATKYLQSSPCEWFICDDSSTYTRCFVIQGLESLTSWQTVMLFESIQFEGTDVLVHRGIYEVAKGIYEQLMPQIMEHLQKFGDKAKLQFTGHCLGGSLSLLVNLMLLTRNIVERSSLLPIVTFGSPNVFCDGQKILDQLGLNENDVHCVMMHRDIAPRVFSCNYPHFLSEILMSLNNTFKSHPCLNKNNLLYSPIGKIFILQPDEKSSASHPLLPPGSGLYTFDDNRRAFTGKALRIFLNSPHPLEIYSDPMAYGTDGTICRDHDSSNYLKALNCIIRQHRKQLIRRTRKEKEA